MTVLYEDNHIIAVNKTCNEIVQGDKTGDTPLSDIVKAYIKEKYHKPGEVFLGVTHRLDRPTSGVVLFARTSKALTRLNAMFQSHEQIRKTYWAIVENRRVAGDNQHTNAQCINLSFPMPQASRRREENKNEFSSIFRERSEQDPQCTMGVPQHTEGRLENYLVRNEKQNKSYIARLDKNGLPIDKTAKKAVLTYKTIAVGEHYTLLEINLETGRHHQIRCQLAAIGCPIKGDLKYGARRSNPDGGICLHARCIEFIHPVSHEPISITAPVPNDALWQTLTSNV